MPIAIVLNTFEPGGTEHQMTELICRLDRARFTVHVGCFGDRGPLRDRIRGAGIPVTEFPLRGLARPDTARQIARFVAWARRRRVRIVHACDFYANVFALPAARFAGVPVRLGSRRDVSIPERTPRQQQLQTLSYAFAQRVVANSSAAAAQLGREGVPAGKIRLIENGLDLARFSDGRTVAGRSVVTVANLRPGKGIDVLLEAARLVRRELPDVRFRIAGDGPLRPQLEAAAARLQLTGTVDFLGHQRDVPRVLREHGVFAFPSLMEAAPNAVIEAMASGIPIVASNAGGIPEVLTHEHSGLLVEPGDARALAAALQRLLTDPALGDRLGRTARETVRARFSFERMVQAFEDLYIQELSGRAGPAAATAHARDGSALA